MSHALGREAAIGIQHAVGVGDPDFAASEKIANLGWRGAREFGKIIMRRPGTGLDESERIGDELLDVAQVLLSLFPALVDLLVTTVEFGK